MFIMCKVNGSGEEMALNTDHIRAVSEVEDGEQKRSCVDWITGGGVQVDENFKELVSRLNGAVSNSDNPVGG